MNITLQNIIPIPLKDRILLTQKEVWNNELSFSSLNKTKIVAPSGTGKTTLMNIIYNLRTDYEGNVLYDNIDVRAIKINDLAKIRQQKLSVIFQDLKLFPQLTAKENIELKRTMQTPFCNENKIDEMAEELGITHILQQKTEKCSYGEQQRIAIIRALIQPFEMLLLDEPFSHLDKKNTQKDSTMTAEIKWDLAGNIMKVNHKIISKNNLENNWAYPVLSARSYWLAACSYVMYFCRSL